MLEYHCSHAANVLNTTVQCITDLSLNHTTSVTSHGTDKVEDVDIPFSVDPLQLVEEGDECSCPSNACTAVDHYWP